MDVPCLGHVSHRAADLSILCSNMRTTTTLSITTPYLFSSTIVAKYEMLVLFAQCMASRRKNHHHRESLQINIILFVFGNKTVSILARGYLSSHDTDPVTKRLAITLPRYSMEKAAHNVTCIYIY